MPTVHNGIIFERQPHTLDWRRQITERKQKLESHPIIDRKADFIQVTFDLKYTLLSLLGGGGVQQLYLYKNMSTTSELALMASYLYISYDFYKLYELFTPKTCIFLVPSQLMSHTE